MCVAVTITMDQQLRQAFKGIVVGAGIITSIVVTLGFNYE